MVTALREIYQIKVQLMDIRPPIWRRCLLSSTSSLKDFHEILQVVMGWENYHLHLFVVNDTRYGEIDPEFANEDDWDDESAVKLKDIFRSVGDSMLYQYDFGDGWQHKITLEKILPFNTDQVLPQCIKGKRHCPPEDVGGTWGYDNMIEILSDPSHPEYRSMKEWVGENFEPEHFSVSEVNTMLAELRRE